MCDFKNFVKISSSERSCSDRCHRRHWRSEEFIDSPKLFLQHRANFPVGIGKTNIVKGERSEMSSPARLPGPSHKSALSRQRRYQLRHKRTGLCHDCSRPATKGGLFCEVHRRKRNLKYREWQHRKFKRKTRYRKAESYKFKEAKNMRVEEPISSMSIT
jgi:hypothetical protein